MDIRREQKGEGRLCGLFDSGVEEGLITASGDAVASVWTQEERRKRLLEAGISQKSLDRLHAPIGLDLGGRAPEEIALAVMAEIVQKLHQRK